MTVTITGIAPPTLVEAPARMPEPYGLFSTFTFRPNTDRWEAGVQWESFTCDPLEGIGEYNWPADGVGTEGLPKVFDDDSSAMPKATPFTVYGQYLCSPTAWSPSEAQARATEQLISREEKRVEQALWTGDLGNIPNLLNGAQTLGVGAKDLVLGLALLEDFNSATYGSIGTIHMTRGTALQMLGLALLETKGARLQTKIGTPVAAGGGYPGTGPSAPGTDQKWAFISPPIFGYQGEVFTSSNRAGDLLDRTNNNLYAVAERSYLLGFDPCGVGAVLLDLNPAP